MTRLLVLLLVPFAVVARAFWRLRRPAPASRPTGRPCVLCLGASTVRGNVSHDWVGELSRRLPDRQWVNAGRNGETSAEILARADAALACLPTHVVVHAGANDVLGQVPAAAHARNLTELVVRLRASGAKVALLSLQPVGDDPEAPPNQDIDRANQIIARVAAEQHVTYLPLNERLRDLLRAHPDANRPLGESPIPFLRAMILHLGLGVSLARAARTNGYAIHTDGLHLGPEAGGVVADLVAEFVEPGE